MKKLFAIFPFYFLLNSMHSFALANFQNNDSLNILIRQALLSSENLLCDAIEARSKIGIRNKIDITGDSVPELIVYLGSGGASSQAITVVRIENGKPTIALFKQKDGTIKAGCFIEGGSATHEESIEMFTKQNAIYQIFKELDYLDNTLTISIIAFRWNSTTNTFDYDSNLSNQILDKLYR